MRRKLPILVCVNCPFNRLNREEIYCDVSIDPGKQNPINLGKLLDSWKQHANSNIAIIMVYHATT